MKFRELLNEMKPYHQKKDRKFDTTIDKELTHKEKKIKCDMCKELKSNVIRVTVKKDLPAITKKFMCPTCIQKNK